MPGSHWMIALTEDNYRLTQKLGFSVLGLKSRHRRKAERMAPGDRVLYFVSRNNVFPAISSITSTFFEDHRPVWINHEQKPDPWPWRVSTRPDIVLEPYEWIDARQLAPRLLYVKRWAPELWPLAFQGSIHLLSSQDFKLVESEMERIVRSRGRRRERPPRRPRAVPTEPGGASTAAAPVGPERMVPAVDDLHLRQATAPGGKPQL
jgi:hypothetical protein